MSGDKTVNRAQGRIRSKWQLDFSTKSGHGAMELVAPPGYNAGKLEMRKYLAVSRQKYFRSEFPVAQ